MSTAQNLIAIEHDVILQTYKRIPVVADRAEGCHITDVQGVTYLDML
ncbi:MAG: hypothetical protein RL156_1064, partial [Bacteroidota bacterium]